jgi:undecaprenyl phosphate N,N'-diacetylbacillosamine 1-phosphate transferase
MTDEKDKDGNLLPEAKRLTKAGQFIRQSSLDEIPQLINVLKEVCR